MTRAMGALSLSTTLHADTGDAVAQRLEDVLAVLATVVACRYPISNDFDVVIRAAGELTRGVVVADGVPRVHAENGAGSTLDRSTANLGNVLPDNLGEVAPIVEAGA